MAPFSTDEYLTAWTRLTTLYVEGRLEEALELACAMEERFPDRRFYIGSARASLHALLDDADAAIRVAREVVESGGWWSERHIADPDLDPVRHHPEFQMLVQAMARLRTRSMDDAAGGPKTTVLTADGSAPTAVVIALHMHGMSAAETVAHWKSATSWGVAVAVPESTQRDADGNRCWDDDELTERDVLLARDHASPAPGAAGGPPVVLAGASQGAGQAIRLAVEGSIEDCRGFIGVVGAPGSGVVEGSMEAASKRGVRGWLIAGEADVFGRRRQEEFQAAALRRGLACGLEVVPGLGHLYPDDLRSRLGRALAFILRDRSRPPVVQPAT